MDASLHQVPVGLQKDNAGKILTPGTRSASKLGYQGLPLQDGRLPRVTLPLLRKLFKPLVIANGKTTLKHRVIYAPLTRNRGTPTKTASTAHNPNRIWLLNDNIADYYEQRATDGGLLVSEGLPPSLDAAMPCVPGIFLQEQAEGSRKVVDAVHRRGGFIYAQLWPSGRANVPRLTGTPTLSASAVLWDDANETFPYAAPHTTGPIKIAQHPPIELTVDHIKTTIGGYCAAAKRALDAGFDGVELHSGNGYLPKQFPSSNSNQRTNEYGGSPEKRCKFVLDLMQALAKTVGQDNLSIRLTPFGLCNQARSQQRFPNLSYVSFIEPPYEQVFSAAEKGKFLESWGLLNVDLSLFREIFGNTPFFSAGGWDDDTPWGVVESGAYNALVYGRYFISNPDLVDRLDNKWPLAQYDRSRFYGPFEG